MAERRAAILRAVRAAHTLHLDLGVRARLEHRKGGRVDVFGAIGALGATLMFQPLDNLLGAFVPAEEPGILITTKRPLSIQRFTAAHELGHLYMQHQSSLDDQGILRRTPFSPPRGLALQELEADAFAAMFLAPAWLVALIVQRQGWPPESLAEPATVYQLSLRLGTSYAATCHVLKRHKAITREHLQHLLSVAPKEIKRALLQGHEPPDWRSDVWLLTDRDEGLLVEGGRHDLFVVRLRENSSAGYLWNFDDLKAGGFALVADGQRANAAQAGALVTRRVTAQASGRISRAVTLREQRPWMPEETLRELHLHYDLRGPEERGMWEPDLMRVLQAA